MSFLFVLIFSLCPLFVLTGGKKSEESKEITLQNCDPNKLVTIDSLIVDPYPIPLPGKVNITLEVSVEDEETAKKLADGMAKLDIRKHVTIPVIEQEETISIPCVNGYGSCEKPVEEMLQAYVPDVLKALEKGYTQISTELTVDLCISDIEALADVAASLASGKYSVKLEVTEKDTDDILLCYNATVEVTSGDKECENAADKDHGEKEEETTEKPPVVAAVPISSCSNQDILELHEDLLTLEPYPVNFPGSINASLEFSVKDKETAKKLANSEIKLSIDRQVSFLTDNFDITVPIPCVSGIGSCTKPLKTYLPDLARAFSDGQTEISLADFVKNRCLPDLGSIVDVLADGTYDVMVEIQEEGCEHVLACFNFTIEVSTEDKEECLEEPAEMTTGTEEAAINPPPVEKQSSATKEFYLSKLIAAVCSFFIASYVLNTWPVLGA